jgi:hypothetical protein
MGDRTTVYLDVLVSQADAAEELFDYKPSTAYQNTEKFVEFEFEEINHGTLNFLNELQEAGIAFDSSWLAGDENGAGSEFCRFTPTGESIRFVRYDSEINPDMNCLMRLIDDSHALREAILNHHKETTPLPWDNQEMYGKLYRTKRLINPS